MQPKPRSAKSSAGEPILSAASEPTQESHESMNADSKKAVHAALGANLGIAIAKFVVFGITRSASMLAEAVHSVADTGNQALLLWGSLAPPYPGSI